VSCPYQTPGAQILRYILDVTCRVPGIVHRLRRTFRPVPDGPRWIPHIPSTFHSVLSNSVEKSLCRITLSDAWNKFTTVPHTPTNTNIALLTIFLLPVWFLVDVCRATIWLLVVFSRGAHSWSKHGSDLQAAVLDPHCISWTLRTSVDGPVRLSTLNYLARTTLADADPTLFVDCFDILIGCVKVINDKAVVTQGMERLADMTVLCCLHTLSYLTTADPTPRSLKSVRQRYVRAFPFWMNFDGLSLSHILTPIHRTFYAGRHFTCWQTPQWEDYKPPSGEHIIVAHALVKIARFEYRSRGRGKVPCWLLRFALHSLSQFPRPPTSVVTDCLSIIAIDLGCDPSNSVTLNERCVRA